MQLIVDEWYETGKTTREIIEAAMKLQEKWGVNRWYADSANPEKIVEAGTGTGLYVIPYDKGKDALTAGISLVQQLLNENLLFIYKGLTNTLNETESYHYPELDSVRQVKMDVPIPEDNHLLDAIRYMIHGYQPAKRYKVEVPSVPSFQQGLKRLLENTNDSIQSGNSYE